MDVILRLRVLIWLLVIGLWGVMVYQYLGDDDTERVQMQPIVNPYSTVNLPTPPPLPQRPPGGGATALEATPSTTTLVGGDSDPTKMVTAPPEIMRPAEVGARRAHDVAARAPAARIVPRTRMEKRLNDYSSRTSDPAVPPGFVKIVTRHFNIYAEQTAASDGFVSLLENLHANLMLDLAPFSPWARDQRVTVFLFRNQETYRTVTGRPAWSAGASSVPKRKVYVYESEELPGILAHELTHIYFDGFFIDGVTDPLWLSEGMATLVQVERGLSAPNWLRENLVRLENGEVLALADLMNVRSTSGWSDARVRLWYAQSFSLVRYMIRVQYRSSFYKFAAFLRDGRSPSESLYRAYGQPYTRLRALEIAWRHEVVRRKDRLIPSEAPRN